MTPENRIEIRKVQLGAQTANRIEIRSGLHEGDLVVTGNRSSLQAGQQVRPKLTDISAITIEGAKPQESQKLMSRFAIQNSVFHRRRLPDHRGGRRHGAGAHAGGHVPDHEYSGGGGRDVLLRHAAGADRDRYHQPLRALLHAWRAASNISNRARCPASASSRCTSSRAPIADSAVTTISNLAMAQLRRLPPGTLPPVVLKFDARACRSAW